MKIKTSISLRKEHREKLKQIARKEDRSVSQVIERIIDRVIGERKEPTK